VPREPYAFAQLVDDALGLMDALALERAHFVGLSMGGMTALGLALAAPDRLASITAANCIARTGPQTHATWDERAHTARTEGMQALVAPTLERWFTAATRAARADEVARIGELIARTPAAGYAAACEALKTLDYLERLPAIAVPTLLIAGRHDAGAPLAAMQDMHARIPGATLVELDTAHLSNVEAPAAFTDAVRSVIGAQALSDIDAVVLRSSDPSAREGTEARGSSSRAAEAHVPLTPTLSHEGRGRDGGSRARIDALHPSPLAGEGTGERGNGASRAHDAALVPRQA
jgi:3-oxoadipate enol-lactonase